jgi:hypothetical protein
MWGMDVEWITQNRPVKWSPVCEPWLLKMVEKEISLN